MSEKRALFDIKPVDDSGLVDVNRVQSIQPVINLASRKKFSVRDQKQNLGIPIKKTAQRRAVEPLTPPVIKGPLDLREEFETALNDTDIHLELANYGIQTHQFKGKPRVRPISQPIVSKKAPEKPNEFESILAEIHHSRMAVSKEPELMPMVALERPVPSRGKVKATPASSKMEVEPIKEFFTPRQHDPKQIKIWRPSRKLLIISGAIILGLTILLAGGWGLKLYVTAQGQSAINQLESAKTDLENMNFDAASEDFVKAYQSFSSADAGLNFMGATISNLIASLPGGGTVKSAQNLVKIGKLLADSGAAMTQAAKVLAGAGPLLTPGNDGPPISSVMNQLQKALAISSADISDIKDLLADTDPSIIPADKREAFQQLSALVPTIEAVVSQGADYAKFFADATSQPGTHRYLILFENSSEIRPTGGFPGSYGVVTFKDGRLEDFFVNDIYNLDGQIKEPIIPPKPLQHITPDWGMRDANWFVDFPTSARVIADFYKMESGQEVQGVITINPSAVTDVLKIIGPITMPEYGLTLTADNFVSTIQNQVEYVADRAQPKKVLVDFAPILLEKLRGASSDQWLAIFNSVITNIDKNAVLMYFNNLSLEAFADDQGFSGQVYQAEGVDFLMPVLSNIKGSKGDLVTDTSFKLSTEFQGDDAVHTLSITRVHRGGNEKYAFYNKQNPAYVRVLVPEGTELINIEGNNKPNFSPIINYSTATFNNFKTNEALAKFENTGVRNGSTGVTTFKEAGKDEFAFWLIVDPGKTKTVTLTYRVPGAAKNGDYNLYFQKQPGLIIKDLSISADSYTRSGPLEKDLKVELKLP